MWLCFDLATEVWAACKLVLPDFKINTAKDVFYFHRKTLEYSGTTVTIIDFHTHTSFHRSHPTPEAVSQVIASARNCGIEKMVVLGDVLRYGYKPSPDQIREINDDTLESINWFPETLIGFCYLNPLHDPEFMREETERCIVQGGFRGIKLEASTNGRDRCVDAILVRAEELDVPVLQHAWDSSRRGLRSFMTDPRDVPVMAKRFPRVKIIMAHLTGCGIKGILAVRPYPNVYPDTSGSQPFSGIVEYAVEKLGPERIIFGTDSILRDFPSQLGRVLGAGLSKKDLQLILHDNAARLLKLTNDA